jgi:predicted O-methyltransferase YrrM
MLGETANNVSVAGVASRVRFIVTTTQDAAAAWAGPIDFLYVDADHTKPSVKADLTLWWLHLRPGGLIAGDDYDNPMYPGVVEAWDEFEQEQGQHFARVETPQTTPAGMRLIYGTKEVWL